jgi:predicted aspartyl protease
MKIGAFLLWLTLMAASGCTGFGIQAAAPDAEPPLAVSATETILQVTPTLSDRIGRIVAPVTINGQGPFYFMLDTGATSTVISAPAAQQLGLSRNAETMMWVHGVSGSAVFPSVRIDSLETGPLQFRDLRLPVLTGSIMAGIDGILGMDGLQDKKITADFVHNNLTILESEGAPAALRYAVVRFDLISKRLPIVAATVGRIHAKAVIDTGGTHTLGNLALLHALAQARGANLRLLRAAVVDATQTSQAGGLLLTPPINLGKVTVNDASVTFGNFSIFERWGLQREPALLIGMDVLGALGEFSIDYRRMELHLMSRQ